MTVGAWRGARPAMAALAVAGDRRAADRAYRRPPDVHKTGVIGELYDNAHANPKTGYYLETLGGVLLLLAGGGLLLLGGGSAAEPEPRTRREPTCLIPVASARPSRTSCRR